VSEQNVEIVRRLNAAFNAGDWETVAASFHPDIKFRDLLNAPDLPEVVRGIDALTITMRQWTGVYQDLGAEALEYIDAEPWVIVDVRWHGTAEGSGIPVDVRQVSAHRIEDGRVVEFTVGYPDVPAALQALAG
jgi:ketosteroid isomerase-like protein